MSSFAASSAAAPPPRLALAADTPAGAPAGSPTSASVRGPRKAGEALSAAQRVPAPGPAAAAVPAPVAAAASAAGSSSSSAAAPALFLGDSCVVRKARTQLWYNAVVVGVDADAHEVTVVLPDEVKMSEAVMEVPLSCVQPGRLGRVWHLYCNGDLPSSTPTTRWYFIRERPGSAQQSSVFSKSYSEIFGAVDKWYGDKKMGGGASGGGAYSTVSSILAADMRISLEGFGDRNLLHLRALEPRPLPMNPHTPAPLVANTFRSNFRHMGPEHVLPFSEQALSTFVTTVVVPHCRFVLAAKTVKVGRGGSALEGREVAAEAKGASQLLDSAAAWTAEQLNVTPLGFELQTPAAADAVRYVRFAVPGLPASFTPFGAGSTVLMALQVPLPQEEVGEHTAAVPPGWTAALERRLPLLQPFDDGRPLLDWSSVKGGEQLRAAALAGAGNPGGGSDGSSSSSSAATKVTLASPRDPRCLPPCLLRHGGTTYVVHWVPACDSRLEADLVGADDGVPDAAALKESLTYGEGCVGAAVPQAADYERAATPAARALAARRLAAVGALLDALAGGGRGRGSAIDRVDAVRRRFAPLPSPQEGGGSKEDALPPPASAGKGGKKRAYAAAAAAAAVAAASDDDDGSASAAYAGKGGKRKRLLAAAAPGGASPPDAAAAAAAAADDVASVGGSSDRGAATTADSPRTSSSSSASSAAAAKGAALSPPVTLPAAALFPPSGAPSPLDPAAPAAAGAHNDTGYVRSWLDVMNTERQHLNKEREKEIARVREEYEAEIARMRRQHAAALDDERAKAARQLHQLKVALKLATEEKNNWEALYKVAKAAAVDAAAGFGAEAGAGNGAGAGGR